MNAEARRRFIVIAVMSVVMGISSKYIHAKNFADIVAVPFDDPLLASPPELKSNTIFLGDAELIHCEQNGTSLLKVMTLSDAVNLGVCNSPQIKGARASIKEQAAQVGSARAAYLPMVKASISRRNQKTEYPGSTFRGNSDIANNSSYIGLTWRLLDFGGRDATRRAANALLETALANHSATLQNTLTNIIDAYFNAQAAKANRDGKERGQTLALQTWEVAKKREIRGAGGRSDTLQAKTALAKANLEYNRAIGTYEKSLATLVLAIGLPIQSSELKEFVLAPDYATEEDTLDQDLTNWLVLAQSQHPALIAVRAQLLSAKEKLAATQSEGLPTLDFSQSLYLNGRPEQGVSSIQSKESITALTLNIPLFDGFLSSYKVRGAQAQIEAKEAEVRNTENQILSEIVKAHADAVAARRNIAASQELNIAAREALDIVQSKYDKGIADILDMLYVQMALADAEQERVRTLSEWSSARLRLLSSIGIAALKDLQKKTN